MMFDKQNLLSDSQDLSQVAGTYVSTNTIDLGAAGVDTLGNTLPNDPGRSGGDILITVDETFTSGGSATVRFDIITSANADLSSPTIIASTPALAYTALTAGYQAKLSLSPGIAQRYLGVQYVIATATTTAGTATAGFVADRQTAHV